MIKTLFLLGYILSASGQWEINPDFYFPDVRSSMEICEKEKNLANSTLDIIGFDSTKYKFDCVYGNWYVTSHVISQRTEEWEYIDEELQDDYEKCDTRKNKLNEEFLDSNYQFKFECVFKAQN